MPWIDRSGLLKALILIECILLVCIAPPAMGGDDPLARIRVEAGASARMDTPVSVSLERWPQPLESGITLTEVRGEVRIPTTCQIEAGSAPRLWWLLTGETPAGSERIFELRPGSAPSKTAVRAVLDERALHVDLKGRRMLSYQHAVMPPPEGVDALYARSAFIHPLCSPAGATLTRIHPEDHYHHVGFWSPFTKTRFEGRSVDFWNLGKGQGTVRFAKVLSRIDGPVYGGFRALHEHVDLSAPDEPRTALNEIWDIRVFGAGGREAGWWLMDFTITLSCASSSPLLIETCRYGGFGFRARESWKEGDYLTSEGKRREDGHATRARWCQVFGPTEKGDAGILFMSHPHNREHPEPMRIWSHTKDIYFNFCPIQKKEWLLEPGRDHVLRYRLHLYDGSLTVKESERIWQDFANPPGTELLRVGDEAEPDKAH
jgi:hypothetical protein